MIHAAQSVGRCLKPSRSEVTTHTASFDRRCTYSVGIAITVIQSAMLIRQGVVQPGFEPSSLLSCNEYEIQFFLFLPKPFDQGAEQIFVYDLTQPIIAH